jgi:hypothetical protein
VKIRQHAEEIVAYMAGQLFEIPPEPKTKKRRKDR